MFNKIIYCGVFSLVFVFKIFFEMSIIYSFCKNGLVDVIEFVFENREILVKRRVESRGYRRLDFEYKDFSLCFRRFLFLIKIFFIKRIF